MYASYIVINNMMLKSNAWNLIYVMDTSYYFAHPYVCICALQMYNVKSNIFTVWCDSTNW